MLHNIKVGNWRINAWRIDCDGLVPSELGYAKGDEGFKMANKIYRWGKKGYEGVIIDVSANTTDILKASMVVPTLVSEFCKKENIYYWAAEKYQSQAMLKDGQDLKIYEDDSDDDGKFYVEFDFFVYSMEDVERIIEYIKSNEFRFMGSLKC
jgi:hypothetical protein